MFPLTLNAAARQGGAGDAGTVGFGMSESQRRDYAVLVSLATREEAEVAASALRADGIDAFVGNTHHAHMEWWLTPALGGAQIMVPAAALGDARATLKARVADWKLEPVFNRARRRDRWRAWTMIAWLFAPAVLVWLLWALWLR